MKKRLLAMLLSCSMVIAMIPMTAAAAEEFELQVRPDTLELNSTTKGYPQIDVVCNYSGTLYVESYDSVADAWDDINVSDFSKRLYYKESVEANTMTVLEINKSTEVGTTYGALAFGFVTDSGDQYGPYFIEDVTWLGFPAGDGSASDPYQIWNPRHLYNIGEYCGSSYSDYHFILMDDINMENWPYSGRIGSSSYATFYGDFDGNSKIIQNNESCLFYELGSTGMIHDLRLWDCEANVSLMVYKNYGTIKDCIAYNGTVYGDMVYEGGTFAGTNYGTIKECSAKDVDIISSSGYVGGIVGENRGGTITQCYSTANVSGGTGRGGIVGENSNSGTITACYANPILIGSSNMGGIAGRITGGTITGCFSSYTGNSYEDDIGSIVGDTYGGSAGVTNFGSVPTLLLVQDEDELDSNYLARVADELERNGTYWGGSFGFTSEVEAVVWATQGLAVNPLSVLFSWHESETYTSMVPYTVFGGSGETQSTTETTVVEDTTATDTTTTTTTTTTTENITFYDVSTSAWYAEDVAAAVEAGVISGKGDGQFDPDGTVTQAEAVKLAAVLYSQLSGDNIVFDQTEGDNWYNTYWTYLDSLYDSPALSDSLMNQTVSRNNFAWILSTVLDTFSEEELAMNQVEDNAIPDVDMNYSHAYEMYRAGIMVGSDSDGTFNPYSNVLRSEMAAIVNRFLDEDARKTITLTYTESTETTSDDGDLTGYVTSFYWYPSYIGESTEGYNSGAWMTGKYVRSDGMAVLYIDSSDSPDYFAYEAYVMASDGKLAWSPAPDNYGLVIAITDGETWAPASAWDDSNDLFFTMIKDGSIWVTDDNDNGNASMSGNYQFVAQVAAGS